jgi:hypothetical protein
MWHKLAMPGRDLDAAIEQMRLMNLLGSGLLRSNVEMVGKAVALREVGVPVEVQQQNVEIYADHDRPAGTITWYLNDAAMEACRRVDANVDRAEVLTELPPPLGRTVMVNNTLFVITRL